MLLILRGSIWMNIELNHLIREPEPFHSYLYDDAISLTINQAVGTGGAPHLYYLRPAKGENYIITDFISHVWSNSVGNFIDRHDIWVNDTGNKALTNGIQPRVVRDRLSASPVTENLSGFPLKTNEDLFLFHHKPAHLGLRGILESTWNNVNDSDRIDLAWTAEEALGPIILFGKTSDSFEYAAQDDIKNNFTAHLLFVSIYGYRGIAID